MAAGMTPPLGLALATVLAAKITKREIDAGKAWIMGASFITEGRSLCRHDPFRVIPSIFKPAVASVVHIVWLPSLPHGGSLLSR